MVKSTNTITVTNYENEVNFLFRIFEENSSALWPKKEKNTMILVKSINDTSKLKISFSFLELVDDDNKRNDTLLMEGIEN